VRNLRYVRTDAPEAPKEKAAVQHDGAQWQLAWSTHRDGNWEVYRQDADGMQVNLTNRASNEWAWNARGDTLLVLSNERRDDEAKGWRGYRIEGGAMSRVSDEVLSDGYIDCTPDGATCAGELMLDGRKRIALYDRAGKRAGLVESPGGDDADPHFSPDGKRMLFRSTRDGHFDLYMGDARGNHAKRLTNDAANDGASRHEYGGEGPAHFSPDGERIAWMRKFPDRGYDVWTMRADGSEQENLTAAHDGSDAYPSWSPDGARIAFDSDRDGANEIYVMDADGGNVRRITMSPGGNLAPMWVRVAAK
jgi:Tol biopolymer transport system component